MEWFDQAVVWLHDHGMSRRLAIRIIGLISLGGFIAYGASTGSTMTWLGGISLVSNIVLDEWRERQFGMRLYNIYALIRRRTILTSIVKTLAIGCIVDAAIMHTFWFLLVPWAVLFFFTDTLIPPDDPGKMSRKRLQKLIA